jgi:predicted ribosome quality control (RQC) complex YloA/Tae2 family protein
VHFSPLWFWALAQELRSKLSGGKITGGRAFQAGLVITVQQEEAWDLLFWLDPRFPRAECLPSRGAHDLPARWKVIDKAVVSDLVQPDSDRRLSLQLQKDSGTHVLQYFAFARPALALVDPTGHVVAAAGADAPKPSRPGKPFLLDVLDLEIPGDPRTLRGLDDLWLKAALQSSEPPWAFLRATGKKLLAGPLTGFVVSEGGNPTGVSLVDFSAQIPELGFENCGSPSHASSRFVSTARREVDLKEQRTAIMNAILDLKSRLTRTLKELEQDRRNQEQYPLLQENADWLTSQLGKIVKGQAELLVPGEKGERRVPMDPALKPHTQADRWYQAARRLKRGMETTQERIELSREKLERLNQLLEQTRDRMESEEPQVSEAFAELERMAQRAQKGSSVRVRQEPVRFRRFRSPGGLAIWVGRNNHENDELTMHAAHKEDLWFHVQQTSGSHVVLRSHALKHAPSEADILAAAATAAYFSRARTSKKVPVIYTLAKYVRKPRKAPAGRVSAEREKSVMVEPGLCPIWDDV